MRVHDLRHVVSERGQLPTRRCSHTWHDVIWERPVTRRQAVATGAAALGALTLPRFAFAAKPSSGPSPIPGGLDTGIPDPPGPAVIHIKLPGYPPFGSPDPATNDPITITDFNGHVGLAYVQGTGMRTDKATSTTATLPFEVDLRFMKGEFVATDGRRRHAAFALI